MCMYVCGSIVFGDLLEEVFHRDDGTVTGVSTAANDIRMYLPLPTVPGVHVRDVRERLPGITLCKVLDSLEDLFREEEKKFLSSCWGPLLGRGGTTSIPNLNLNLKV
jgi:hypothetical protein